MGQENGNKMAEATSRPWRLDLETQVAPILADPFAKEQRNYAQKAENP
jgi:hypothetical protein